MFEHLHNDFQDSTYFQDERTINDNGKLKTSSIYPSLPKNWVSQKLYQSQETSSYFFFSFEMLPIRIISSVIWLV